MWYWAFIDICRLSEIDDLHIALEGLTQSVKCLIELYCRTFHTDFRLESTTNIIRGQNQQLYLILCTGFNDVSFSPFHRYSGFLNTFGSRSGIKKPSYYSAILLQTTAILVFCHRLVWEYMHLVIYINVNWYKFPE